MTKAALSLKLHSVYLTTLAPGLVLFPHLLLPVFSMPVPSEVWIRVVGVLTFNIGVYYWFAAKAEATGFLAASVYTRTLVLAVFGAFVYAGYAPPMLVLFGVVDFLSGLVTLFFLLTERRPLSVEIAR